MIETTINIGCGCGKYPFKDFKAYVNCDIAKPNTKINNFILCDCHYLPFRNKIFNTAIISHVIEHLKYPDKALDDTKRITKDEIKIYYPFYLSQQAFMDLTHKWFIINKRFYPIPKSEKFRLLINLVINIFKSLNKKFFYRKIHLDRNEYASIKLNNQRTNYEARTEI